MPFLNQLLTPYEPCEDAIIQLCKKLSIKVTKGSIRKDILEHPNYPSLTSIMDVLSNYGVANGSVKMPAESFKELPLPFIALIRGQKLQHNLFAPVFRISETYIEFYNPEWGKVQKWDVEKFNKSYQDTVMVLEAGEYAGEKDYEKKLTVEKQSRVVDYVLVFALPVVTLIVCLRAIIFEPVTNTIAPIIFTLLNLTGFAIGALLLLHEIDQNNQALKQVCQAGKKVNCSVILNSKASKIFGFNWSSVGFCYFTGMLMAVLVSGITNPATLQLLSWINLLALPYVLFSIYYQWWVAKQWCILCIAIQGLLVLQIIIAWTGNFHNSLPLESMSSAPWVTIAVSFVFVAMAILLLIPALKEAKKSRQKILELQRLKHNPQIFEALLAKQKTIEKPDNNLGITIGNINRVYKILNVCNPYCEPCASAHPAMEALAANNEEVCFQVIFTATGDEHDINRAPVTHMLAIDSKNKQAQTKKALDDWYNAPRKDYAAFAAKHPMNGELQQQDDKLKQMKLWCDTTGITSTPTFFICLNTADDNARFYQLPDLYTVSDLKYFLTL